MQALLYSLDMRIFKFIIFFILNIYITNALALGKVNSWQFVLPTVGNVTVYNPLDICNEFLKASYYKNQIISSGLDPSTFYVAPSNNPDGCAIMSSRGVYDYKSGSKILSCPENSSSSGDACTCNSGFNEKENQCVPKDPCDGLVDACSGSSNFTTRFVLPGNKTGVSFTCMNPVAIGIADPFPGCSKGCMAQVGGFTTAFQNAEGGWVTTGSAKYSGATCDPSVINDLNAEEDPEYVPEENPTVSDAPDASCPNGFKGQVNGVTVCVPPKSSSGVTELEEKDNGDGTKTNTKTEVKCENGKCEITKTSTTTNTSTGSTVNSSSVTTTVDKAVYCVNNSKAGVCKDESGGQGEGEGSGGKFGGSCESGFTCEGDAVQCAMAKEQHRRMCQLFDEKAPQLKLYDDEKGKEGVQRGEEGEVIDLPGRISTDTIIGAGSCMQDLQVQFMDRPLTVKLSLLCPYLEMLGNILIAVGMLMAIRIVGVR